MSIIAYCIEEACFGLYPTKQAMFKAAYAGRSGWAKRVELEGNGNSIVWRELATYGNIIGGRKPILMYDKDGKIYRKTICPDGSLEIY